MKTFFISILSFLFLFSACKKAESPAAAPAPPKTNYAITSVEGFVAKPSILSETITAVGTLVPAEETALHPEASGRVISINLPEGKAVKKGELLVKIFDEDLKSQLAKWQTQLKQAEITEQRLAELLKVKGVSQQEYDLAVLQVQNIKSDIELSKINIAKTELRAPYDGILGLRNISPGAYITPATAITNIRAVSSLKLDFSVPEKYSIQLKTGQQVNFHVEGNPQNFQATVIATEQKIDAASRNLAVRAMVKSGSNQLLPGSFAEVDLNLGKKTEALLIPIQAIVPQARSKQVIVSKNGKAQFVTVKTGIRQSNMIEITEGISAGDTIATTGILFLKPDAPVKFSKID